MKPNNKKTVQERQKELIKELSGKIDGFTDEMLETLTLQELQTISDNMTMVKAENGGKKRTNIATEILAHFLENDIKERNINKVADMVRVKNVLNYFDLVDGHQLPTTREAINVFIALKYLKSNNPKVDQAKRQSDWLKRGIAYVKSHLVGTNNPGCLYLDDGATHYFKEVNGTIQLVEK